MCRKKMDMYISLILLTKNDIQFSCDNIALLKATLGSLTESFVQQNNIPAKLDQVLTRFHKLDKANLPSNGRLNRRFFIIKQSIK